MTVDLEDRVRESLREHAHGIEVRGPSPEGVFRRVRARRVRRRTTRAAVGVVAVTVIAFGIASRESNSTVKVDHAANQPAGAPLGHPAMVALDGWKVTAVFVIDTYTEYQFANGDQKLQVSFYDLGSRTGNSTNPTEVALRRTTGVTTDEGAPRYRVDWDEQGRTWEADGEPFPSVDEFLSVLEGLRVIDEATWRAILPDGVAQSILANQDKGVTWYDGKGVSCFGPQDSVPCN